MVMHFLTTYEDRDNLKNPVVTSVKKIAYNYIRKGSFLTDLIAIIPVNLLITEESEER